MSLLFKLYIIFAQIGLFSFGGGYAVLPLIQRYIVEKEGWLSMLEMTDVISISQMTPGPIAINSATFVGTKVAGLAGAMVATIGNVTPQLIIMMIFAHFIFGEHDIPFIRKMLKGLRPGIIGLIAIAAVTMFQSSIWPEDQYSVVATITFVTGFILKQFFKLDLMKIIPIGAVLGIILKLVL